MLLQKSYKLGLKIVFLVVLFLSGDVSERGVHLRPTN